MSSVDSKPGVLAADTSLINPEFIRRLQAQRVVHTREVAFHQAEAEKHGAADEALASMIQAAEKIVAMMFPTPAQAAADAPYGATPQEANSSPSWTEARMAVAGEPAGRLAYSEAPAAHGLEDAMSDDRTEKSGNMWRARLLGGRG